MEDKLYGEARLRECNRLRQEAAQAAEEVVQAATDAAGRAENKRKDREYARGPADTFEGILDGVDMVASEVKLVEKWKVTRPRLLTRLIDNPKLLPRYLPLTYPPPKPTLWRRIVDRLTGVIK